MEPGVIFRFVLFQPEDLRGCEPGRHAVSDEFDTFLHHPVLNKAEFFGGLRSLSSLSGGALVLVIASRQSLTALNSEAQQYNRTGSPFFNIFDEITLGPFSKTAAGDLLSLAGGRFNAKDRQFIMRLAGGHPYLLQAAASALWDAYADGEDDSQRRREIAGDELYTKAAMIISDTWRLWPPRQRKAFTIVALDQMYSQFGYVNFDIKHLRKDLPALKPELRALKKQGYITPDEEISGGWGVQPMIFTVWLADELLSAIEADDELGEYIREHYWEGLFKQREKQQLLKAAQGIGKLLEGGVTTFIKAAAEGFGKGVGGAP